MRKNIIWTSIMEAMVATMILTIWIVWTYSIYFNSVNLSNSSKNRITAIEMAREWIEAVINIRNTNWLNYAADYQNCWNTLNYNNLCVWSSATTYDIWTWSYKIYKNSDNKWFLENWSLSNNYPDSTYRNFYRVNLDSSWFYTQSWGTAMSWVIFTREIKIDYIDTNWDFVNDSNDEKMKVKSLILWKNKDSSPIQKIELETLLTDWKNAKN